MLADQEIDYDTYTILENDVSLNKDLSSNEILDLVRLAYSTYYTHRNIPYDDPDTVRFLTSLPKMRY
jgi:hypothetical protein